MSVDNTAEIIVQKFGGATLADPQLVKQVAARISALRKSGKKVVAVVSAMGKTTNQLIELAQAVSPRPNRRELDMLLSTGERVSMALVSMALHDQGVDAISFTGSQAGILTDASHVNAIIKEVKAFRVLEALGQNKVVVLAGYQGVSAESKEITTLGRGGTDTSAVAMAAFLKAARCEILKDVDGVFSADPKLVKNARRLSHLNYQQMMEMTFWGAKVLHYRSVELAANTKVRLFIGPSADSEAQGTWVTESIPDKEKKMFESQKVLAINSHEQVLALEIDTKNLAQGLETLQMAFTARQITEPQILHWQQGPEATYVYLTGPQEILNLVGKEFSSKSAGLKVLPQELCSVSVTCTGSTSSKVMQEAFAALAKENIKVHSCAIGSMTLALFLDKNQREHAIQTLHPK
jgi:aspartate kinase